MAANTVNPIAPHTNASLLAIHNGGKHHEPNVDLQITCCMLPSTSKVSIQAMALYKINIGIQRNKSTEERMAL